ncbi:MAG TPA: hypothetical protein PLN32_00175 [Methanoregulaceae archaeon]|nr:hypothetical protein [Methanoregulaceae archaeon]
MEVHVHHLFRLLRMLLGSCAEHDPITDAFVTPANRDEYRTALEGIRDCTATIRSTGITRDQLTSAIRERERQSSLTDGTIGDPRDLVPLILAQFTEIQKAQVDVSCRVWGMTVSPRDPEPVVLQLRSTITPLSLEDLLSPGITRMQRIPAALLLETAGQIPSPGSPPLIADDGRILIPHADDPDRFSGHLYTALFISLVRAGMIPEPVFSEFILQTAADTGVIQNGGITAFTRTFGRDAFELFEAGEELFFREGMVPDIRELFAVILAREELEKDLSFGRVEGNAGHLFAGMIQGASGDDQESGISLLLECARTLAGRVSGRAEPGDGLLKNLDRTMQEQEQLLRAVSGDYQWRAVPLLSTVPAFSPILDLWPERHLILYNPDELAFRSGDATKALLMEAWYREWFGIQPHGHDLPDDPWFLRLVRVIGLQRAVWKGSALHPGVIRWIDRFCQEEYALVNRCADRGRIRRLPLPDQFLEGVLFEGRIGQPASHIEGDAVRHALAATAIARWDAVAAPDETYLQIITEQVWPFLAHLCQIPSKGTTGGGVPHSSQKSPSYAPHGSVDRPDTIVPSPHQPSHTATGRALAGNGMSIIGDGDGILTPGGSPFSETRPGRMSGRGRPSLGKAPGARGSGEHGPGIPATADALVEACGRSEDLLDNLVGAGEQGVEAGADNIIPDQGETISDLSGLARQIDSLAETLEQQLLGMQEGANSIEGSPSGRKGEELDGLLKTSRDIRKAAREYRDAVEGMEFLKEASASNSALRERRTGMTKEAFRDLQKAGVEFQRRCATSASAFDEGGLKIRLTEAPGGPGIQPPTTSRGRMIPSFVPDTSYSPDVWDSFSYFDATYDDGSHSEPEGPSGTGKSPMEQKPYDPGEQALTREAEQYLSALKQRTKSDWETIEEKAERIRRIALFESHAVGEDDYTIYQRFYQPVAGLIGVARKNIQQALQKSRGSRDLNELMTGDDIDEENLAAVRTTMRIFRDREREPDRTRWCLSLLIDASSSMHDETVAKKLQATIQAALLFGEAVTRIPDIRFEIAAFTDSEYIPLKRYLDDWNVHQGCYLIRQVIHATGGTNDVGAVSSALERMNRLRMGTGTNRMVFVISDGQSGVGGREQMRAILRTTRDTRIFGWGIGPDMEQVEATYRPYGTWVRDIADLPQSLGEELRRELGRPAMAGWREGRSISAEESCQD